MNPDFYKRVCKGRLEPVLENIKVMHEAGIHLEITNLVITDLNDSDEDFEKLTEFVASISESIPLHFSAYYPTYKMSNPPTSLDRLLRAYEIARKKLNYVYLGNVRLPEKSDTFCPNCGQKLISRDGYTTLVLGLNKGICTKCGFKTGIIE